MGMFGRGVGWECRQWEEYGMGMMAVRGDVDGNDDSGIRLGWELRQ